ncbi:MAG TPA: hypothetical protein VFX09_07795, partial [Burkholderiales bacterium]|nr:hypothetical protein [Burkholderiales bacterium]
GAIEGPQEDAVLQQLDAGAGTPGLEAHRIGTAPRDRLAALEPFMPQVERDVKQPQQVEARFRKVVAP